MNTKDRMTTDGLRAARRSGTTARVLRRGASLALTVVCGAAALAATGGGIPGVGEPGGPSGPLSESEMQLWLQGRALFDRDFTPAEGLGVPEFNADSCRACHFDPVMGGAGPLELNVSRFANNMGGHGPFTNLPGGQMLSKLRPPLDNTRENYPVDQPDPSQNADLFEQRQTPTLLGLGLIESIPEAVILANQDPLDLNGDQIKGVARILDVAGTPEVGRFGWKAQIPRVSDFVRDAMGGEMGITTPDDGRGFAFVTDVDAVADPELSPSDTDALTFFLANLGPPIPGDQQVGMVQRGKLVFTALRCDRCHIPVLEGANGPVPLYSDLLLHDVMGPAFQGMEEPGAPSGMYRTPPLWGVKDTAPYMHDGRAATVQDAILQHKGEARFSSIGYQALGLDSQRALLAFLESL